MNTSTIQASSAQQAARSTDAQQIPAAAGIARLEVRVEALEAAQCRQ